MLIPSRRAQSEQDLIMVIVDCRLRLPTNPKEYKKNQKIHFLKHYCNFALRDPNMITKNL